MEQAKYTISVAGRRIEVTREKRPLSELKLDPRNQRLQYILTYSGKDPASVPEPEIEDILRDYDFVKDLYQSIKLNGGTLDPLIVEADGKVMEGNCRLICLRQLCEEIPGDSRFCQADCETIGADLTEEERSLMLGIWHVAGKHEWPAFEQAEHLCRMKTKYNRNDDYLAHHFRLSRATIGKKIAAYGMMTEFLRKYPEPKNISKWSYFEEFHKKPPLRQRMEADSAFRDKFFDWVGQGKLTEGKQVRKLPQVIADPALETILDQRGFIAVEQHLALQQPEATSNVYRGVTRASTLLKQFPLEEIEELKNGNKAKVNEFLELGKAWKRIADLTGLKLP